MSGASAISVYAASDNGVLLVRLNDPHLMHSGPGFNQVTAISEQKALADIATLKAAAEEIRIETPNSVIAVAIDEMIEVLAAPRQAGER